MSEEENVSLLYNLNDLSSVVLNVAIKSQALFSVRLIGNSWNSERPAALNVFWHRRISSDTSFLSPDSSELRNESLNFNSLRSESFWPSQWSCTTIQSKAVSASQYKHRCMAQMLWPFAGANCQELKLCFSWCTNIRDVRMLNQPNIDIHSGLDTLPQPTTA